MMTKTNQTPSLYTLQFLATVLIFTLLATNTAQAQLLVDVEAPIIELEALAETEADGSQVFSALVADDQQLKDVTLYHRRSGQQAFTRQDMEPLGDTGYYSATLTTDPSDLRAIEYYLQARDEGGNRTVRDTHLILIADYLHAPVRGKIPSLGNLQYQISRLPKPHVDGGPLRLVCSL